jgi:PadR family transcriptional regulator PadR
MSDALLRDEIPPGTLEMLILKCLDRAGKLHGFEIAEAIQKTSVDVLRVEEGSLYPALQRLLRQGCVTAVWGATATNRRARYYELTQFGRTQLITEIETFRRVNLAIFRILQLT